MIWLMETKIDATSSHSLQLYLCFDNSFISHMINMHDGFALFWNNSISLNFLSTRTSYVICETNHPLATNEKKHFKL